MTRILVNGALGRMGSEVVRTVLKQSDMELVAAVDIMAKDKMVDGANFAFDTDLETALARLRQ